MKFYLENKKYFFLDLWIINKFYCGYFKKFLYNDILFSYMYIVYVKWDRGKFILKVFYV